MAVQKEKVYDINRRSFLFSIGIIRYLDSNVGNYVLQTLGKQLLRSATSIGANVVEAQAAPSRKDFANFYNIALRSANETKYWLMLLQEVNDRAKHDVELLLNEADELSKILAKSLLTMRGR